MNNQLREWVRGEGQQKYTSQGGLGQENLNMTFPSPLFCTSPPLNNDRLLVLCKVVLILEFEIDEIREVTNEMLATWQ